MLFPNTTGVISITVQSSLEAAVTADGAAEYFTNMEDSDMMGKDFTKANITYMPWSANRVEAVFHAAEPELRAKLKDYKAKMAQQVEEKNKKVQEAVIE